MATQGPNSGGTFGGGGGTGDVTWTNPSNAASSDDFWAVAALTTAQVTYELSATDFGFSIPTGATIDGIVVEWEKSRDGPTKNVTDSAVRIVKGGTVGATDRSNTGVNWSLGDTYDSYGGAADLWGESWSYSDINSSGFGAAIKATSATTGQAQVDHCRITVHYTEAVFNPANGFPWLPVVQRTQMASAKVTTYGNTSGVN